MNDFKVRIIPPKKSFGKTRYLVLEDMNICGYTIPKGFISDGATVPRLFWWIIPPNGSYFYGAILHDYMLSIKINRFKCDKRFRCAMTKLNVNKIVKNVLFYAVVTYGLVVKPKDYF